MIVHAAREEAVEVALVAHRAQWLVLVEIEIFAAVLDFEPHRDLPVVGNPIRAQSALRSSSRLLSSPAIATEPCTLITQKFHGSTTGPACPGCAVCSTSTVNPPLTPSLAR